jgi:hypothetical protein
MNCVEKEAIIFLGRMGRKSGGWRGKDGRVAKRREG